MKTFALDSNWDLYIDDSKSIATKSDENQIAQDVASSVRVWQGECPMDTDRGIDYRNPESLRGVLNFEMKEQAKLIEGVSDASAVFDKLDNRELNATIYVKTDNGETIEVK